MSGDIVRPPHGSASCACLFCWHDIATLTTDLAAERAEVEALRNEVYETNDHVLYLLDSYHLWSEDGVFAMPDGWMYYKGGPS